MSSHKGTPGEFRRTYSRFQATFSELDVVWFSHNYPTASAAKSFPKS